MVGITLSPEQIKSAPSDVREWLAHEITASLGLGLVAEHAETCPQLSICSQREAEAIFARVSGMFSTADFF